MPSSVEPSSAVPITADPSSPVPITADSTCLDDKEISGSNDIPPYQDPNNSVVLAVNWIPSYMLFHFSSNDWQRFLKNQLKSPERQNVLTSIHASWVLDKKNKHKWRHNLKWKHNLKGKFLNRKNRKVKMQMTEEERKSHYPDLKRYLMKGNNFQNLHKYWGNLNKWKPLCYDTKLLMIKHNWDFDIKDQFVTVVDSFIKHGHSLAMTLEEYIEFTLRFYERVDVARIFRDSNEIKFPRDDQNYTFKEKNIKRTVLASQLACAFSSNAICGFLPKLNFVCHESKKCQGELCVLTEVKYRFDVNGVLVDHHDSFECDGHKDMDKNHSVCILSPSDRVFLETV